MSGTSFSEPNPSITDQLTSIQARISQLAQTSKGAREAQVFAQVISELEDVVHITRNSFSKRALISRESRWHYPEYAVKWETIFANRCIDKLISDYRFSSVLDVGAGRGKHSQIFAEFGKFVTAIDIADFEVQGPNIAFIRSDINDFSTEQTFDCVWCSHILEHQLNPHNFLGKIHDLLNEGGVLAVTVPPLKDQIVGGHVSLWNAGVLLYHLVLAGFDCSDAAILAYDYNISVIVQKKSIREQLVEIDLYYDSGDITKLSGFFPVPFREEGFDGNISKHNWFTKEG